MKTVACVLFALLSLFFICLLLSTASAKAEDEFLGFRVGMTWKQVDSLMERNKWTLDTVPVYDEVVKTNGAVNSTSGLKTEYVRLFWTKESYSEGWNRDSVTVTNIHLWGALVSDKKAADEASAVAKKLAKKFGKTNIEKTTAETVRSAKYSKYRDWLVALWGEFGSSPGEFFLLLKVQYFDGNKYRVIISTR